MAEPSLVLDELETLEVYGDTAVGWDEHTPINETVDEEGNPSFGRRPGFGVPDPRAPSQRVYDHPDVERLRAHLKRNNGIQGIEICDPDEVERAARIFRRDGFVVSGTCSTKNTWRRSAGAAPRPCARSSRCRVSASAST